MGSRVGRIAPVFLALTACTAPAETPSPSPPVQRVATAPALGIWAADLMESYSLRYGDPGIDLEVLPREAALGMADLGSAQGVILSGDPPEGWFATPLGRVPVVVAVHAYNPVRDLSLSDLRAIFSGRVTSWEHLGGIPMQVVPLVPLQGDPVRQLLENVVLAGARPTTLALVAPSPEATLTLVREHRGAVGFLILSSASRDVRALAVDGVKGDPEAVRAGRYPLYLDIVAASPEPPSGPLRAWLAWIQSSLAGDP